MKKCDYCAKEISYFDQYCDEECHAKANQYYEKCEKFEKVFSIINMLCVFGIPVGLFLFSFQREIGTAVAVISCAVLGLMILFLPFPTENMISKYKIRNAIKRTRIIGLCIIGLGLAIVGFMWFFVK